MGDRRADAGSQHPAGSQHAAGPQHPAGALPFGAVMATGAVSQLSDLAGLPALRTPLLALTIVIAAAVTARSAVRRARGGRSHPSLTASFGQFTVPVGLAVIAVGLVEAAPGRHDAGASTPTAAEDALLVAGMLIAAAAGVSTVVVAAIVWAHVRKGRPGLIQVNGVWLIAPAAFLADAVAASAVAPLVGASASAALAGAALVAVVLGTVGYAAALVGCAFRMRAHGLASAPQAAWWIVVGCGGLDAFALGRAGRVTAGIAPGAPAVFDVAAVACWAVATVVLVPVAAGSILFLLRRAPRLGRAPWPPAFSTGVYALGCSEVASTLGWASVAALARAAAVETLAVWLAIAAIHVLAWLSAMRTARHRHPSS